MLNYLFSTSLQTFAEDLLKKHQIPALSVAIWKDNQLHRAAAGLLNIETSVAATPDSVFQIGSITKVFTSCLVMQLADEGRIELNRPVQQYIRDFHVADSEATRIITVQQLLNHTSGMMGDFFPNDNLNEGNPIARYLDRCYLLPQVHPPGSNYSYSNAAFAIAGRLIEVILGQSWFEAIEERIFKPLNMEYAVAHPMNTLRYRTAIGHIQVPGTGASRWHIPANSYLSMGLAPAGTTLAMSASDLLLFAKAHLNEGQNDSGASWLSPGAIQRMQQSEIQLPTISRISDRYAGLGWAKSVFKPSNTTVLGHNGVTSGCEATLKLVPEKNLAFAVLINGRKPGVLESIFCELMMSLAGINCEEPEPEEITADLIAPERFIGQYKSFDSTYTLALENNKLVARIVYHLDSIPPLTLFLIPFESNFENYSFTAYQENGQRWTNIVFIKTASSEIPKYLFAGTRLNART